MKLRDLIDDFRRWAKDHPDKLMFWGAVIFAFWIGWLLG